MSFAASPYDSTDSFDLVWKLSEWKSFYLILTDKQYKYVLPNAINTAIHMDNLEQKEKLNEGTLNSHPILASSSLSATSLDNEESTSNGINIEEIVSDNNLALSIEEDGSATDTEISSQDNVQQTINLATENSNGEGPSDDEDGEPIPSGTVSRLDMAIHMYYSTI